MSDTLSNLRPLQRIDLLITQWGDAPRMRGFVEALLTVVEEELAAPVRTLDLFAEIDRAEGLWLDRIGERFGAGRPTVSGKIAYFGFDGNGTPFDAGPLFSLDYQLGLVTPIGDRLFRVIVKLAALSTTYNGTAADTRRIVNAALTEGTSCTVNDSGAMEAEVAFRGMHATDIDILLEHDLIPRPFGVAINKAS